MDGGENINLERGKSTVRHIIRSSSIYFHHANRRIVVFCEPRLPRLFDLFRAEMAIYIYSR